MKELQDTQQLFSQFEGYPLRPNGAAEPRYFYSKPGEARAEWLENIGLALKEACSDERMRRVGRVLSFANNVDPRLKKPIANRDSQRRYINENGVIAPSLAFIAALVSEDNSDLPGISQELETNEDLWKHVEGFFNFIDKLIYQTYLTEGDNPQLELKLHPEIARKIQDLLSEVILDKASLPLKEKFAEYYLGKLEKPTKNNAATYGLRISHSLEKLFGSTEKQGGLLGAIFETKQREGMKLLEAAMKKLKNIYSPSVQESLYEHAKEQAGDSVLLLLRSRDDQLSSFFETLKGDQFDEIKQDFQAHFYPQAGSKNPFNV